MIFTAALIAIPVLYVVATLAIEIVWRRQQRQMTRDRILRRNT